MAKRRMFSIEVVESDEFCLLKASAQMLYFHLNMSADDDGIVDKWKNTLRYLRVKREHLNELINTGFIIKLDEDTLLIADWLVHNKIRPERYIESRHRDKLDTVQLLPTGRYIKG